MKHICFLTGLYGRRDPLIVERQGRSLAADGYRVSYIVCDRESDEQIYGIEISSCGFIPANRADRMRHSSKHLYRKAMEIDADIYQISEPELIGLGLKLKRRGKKIVFNLREDYISNVFEKSYIPKPLRWLVSLFTKLSFKRHLPKYDAVFSVTDDISEKIIALGVDCQTVRNFPLINPQHELSAEEYLSRRNYLLYYGTVYRVSCQTQVFDALSEIDDITYRIAGPCESDFSQHPYWSRVVWSGAFTKAELEELYRNATISNVLRDFNAIGLPNGSYGILKMFESMEAGLPILCSDVKINREIIQQYGCGICVDPYNVKAIGQAIRYLCTHREEAYNMGQRGRKAVKERFNWEREYVTYKEIIEL
ncbi:MAG: glycosyltransferase [Alistipes sp.]|nr:glycosyltransferase [Alistipes sp.]